MSDETEDKMKPTPMKLGSDTEAKLKSILQGGLKAKAEAETPAEDDKPRIEFERDKTFDTPAESVDPTTFNNPVTQKFLETIDVTDFEKEKFYEALMLDEPFTLAIEVLGKKTIQVSSRNTYEQALCYACLGDMIREADKNEQPAPDLILWLQRFSCCFAIKDIFGKPQNPLSFTGDSENINPEHKEILRKTATERYLNMDYPRWQTILMAFMTFTAKEKILLEHVANRDFWNPAG